VGRVGRALFRDGLIDSNVDFAMLDTWEPGERLGWGTELEGDLLQQPLVPQ